MFSTYKKDLKIQVSEHESDHNPTYFPSTNHSTFPIKTRYSSDLSILSYPDHASTISTNEQDQSSRSIKITNTPRGNQRVSFVSEPPLLTSHCSADREKEIQQFASIERILKNQNDNLKMQNELLLKEVHKLKQTNHRYREQHRKNTLEVEELRLECEAQKRRADEMKEIIMSRLAQLEGKIIGGEGGGLGRECDSILEALTLSGSLMK